MYLLLYPPSITFQVIGKFFKPFPAERSTRGLWNITSAFYLYLATVPGWSNTDNQHSRKPWTLGAIQTTAMDRILRIGVFYDGSHFTYAQNHFYGRKLGWLCFPPFHNLLEGYTRKHYPGFLDYKVVYSAWYQGLFTTAKADDKKLKLDRNRHHDLMHAGIETKFFPMSQSQGEKGIDVAMAIDIFQIGMDGIMDVAVLVTGDGDFVPLVRALMKRGIIVVVAYFGYEENGKKSFANQRLKDCCNYVLDINGLETDREFKGQFKSLFKEFKTDN